MPKSFLVSIDLNKNELQNAAIHPLNSDPSLPSTGQIYLNTSTGLIKFYNGTNWEELAINSGVVNAVNGGSGIDAVTSSGTVTVSHSDTSSVANTTNAGATVLQSMTFDGFGHVQTVSTKSLTLSDLGYTGAADADKYVGFTVSTDSGTTSNVGAEGTLSVTGDGGIEVAASGLDVTITNTDKGSTQSIFKNISADNGGNSVADNNNDTLSLIGGPGGGISTTSNPATDTVTFSVDNTVVRTTGSQTIAGDKTFQNNVSISGNLTVSGSVVTTISETVNVEDSVMYLNSNAPDVPVDDSGFIVNRGLSDNAGFIWDESEDEFAAILTSSDASGSGAVTIGSYADFKALNLYSQKIFLSSVTAGAADYDKFLVLDGTEVKTRTGLQVRSDIGAGTVSSVAISASGALSVSGSPITTSGTITLSVAVSSTTQQGVVRLATSAETISMSDSTLAVTPSGLASIRIREDVGDGNATSYLVEHNFNTRDVIVQVYDNDTYETVITDVVRTNLNSVTITFNVAPTTNAYRVLIMKA